MTPKPRPTRRRLAPRKPQPAGRVYRTVGVSLSPAHVAWVARMGTRTGIGPSRYVQALIGADQRANGGVLAQAFCVDGESREGRV